MTPEKQGQTAGRVIRVLSAGVLLLLGMSACAGIRHDLSSPKWHCDPQSDAAVDNEDWPTAMAGHERYLLKDPSNCLAMYHLGYIWGRLDDRSREIHFYEQAIACGYVDDDRLFFNLGMAWRDSGEFGAALAAFERAIALQPAAADNYFGLGLAAREAGQPDDALKALNKAAAIDPRHEHARLALAQIYLDLSQWDAARFQLEAVREWDPGNEEAEALWELMQSRQSGDYGR